MDGRRASNTSALLIYAAPLPRVSTPFLYRVVGHCKANDSRERAPTINQFCRLNFIQCRKVNVNDDEQNAAIVPPSLGIFSADDSEIGPQHLSDLFIQFLNDTKELR
jgi:hypothetical protein